MLLGLRAFAGVAGSPLPPGAKAPGIAPSPALAFGEPAAQHPSSYHACLGMR